MNSSDFRADARQKLAGKWGKAALISFCYAIIAFILNFISSAVGEESSVASIVSLVIAIIEVPLSFGLIISFITLFKGEEVKPFDFLTSGFNNFARAWKVSLWTVVKLLIPFILLNCQGTM